MAAGQFGKGEHIVEIDPAKRLGRARLLAGGAEGTEGDIHRAGEGDAGQIIKIDRQPVVRLLARLATEQGQFMFGRQLLHQFATDQAAGSGNQDPAHGDSPCVIRWC